MAGPIARRRRPRVESFTFRRLWWVLEREAFVRLVVVDTTPDEEVRAFRRTVARWPRHRIRHWVAKVYGAWPARMIRP